MTFHPGQAVRIRCTVRPGPFSNERLISVQGCDGPILGFVQIAHLECADAGDGFVVARVVGVNARKIRVYLVGSFFTTNGLMTVEPDHVTPAQPIATEDTAGDARPGQAGRAER